MNSNRNDTPRVYLEEAFSGAKLAYQTRSANGQIPDGWSHVEGGKIPQEMLDRADCSYVRSGATQAEFIAFRGTSTGADWKDNVRQVSGGSAKYAAAAAIGRRVGELGLDVTFTGHSLGGGLAKIAGEAASKSSATDRSGRSYVVTSFNGAPVSPATYRSESLAEKEHLRTTYHVMTDTDVLTRTLKGGKQTLLRGEPIAAREPVGSRLLSGKASGSYGVAGHKLPAFEQRPPIDLRDVDGGTYSFDVKKRALEILSRDARPSASQALGTVLEVRQHPARSLERTHSHETSR